MDENKIVIEDKIPTALEIAEKKAKDEKRDPDPETGARLLMRKLRNIRESGIKHFSPSKKRLHRGKTKRVYSSERTYLGHTRKRLPKPRKGFCDMRLIVAKRQARKFGHKVRIPIL